MPRQLKGVPSVIATDPKRCRNCGADKALTEFNRDRSRPDGYDNSCRDCRRRQHSDFTPHRNRDYNLRTMYGITQREWDYAFAMQMQCCALCGGSDPGSKRGWNTDHDHRKAGQVFGTVRGILCYACNQVVGFIDNGWLIPGLEHVMEYINDPPFPHYMADLHGELECEEDRLAYEQMLIDDEA